MEDGFKAMSRTADELVADGQNKTEKRGDEATDETADSVSKLQRLLVDEIRARPLRALGWAAAAGLLLGLWAAR